MSAHEPTFFDRWSRRKAQARQVPPPPEAAAAPPTPATPPELPPAPPEPLAAGGGAAAASAPPTMADVARLTRNSDYTRFVARDAAPEVRNAALKQLFTDPHFNVMDGLDTYIDDYSKPDPLPAGMLRQMAQAHMLGLFDGEPEAVAGTAGTAVPGMTPLPSADAPVQPAPTLEAPPPTALTPANHHLDEDPDLQLQPDDDAGRAGTAPGAGEDAAGQR
jgi:hypothetical protein